VLAERLYGAAQPTALAMTCWLSGAPVLLLRKAVRFAGLDATVWSLPPQWHARAAVPARSGGAALGATADPLDVTAAMQVNRTG
jgi:hypothetical protein